MDDPRAIGLAARKAWVDGDYAACIAGYERLKAIPGIEPKTLIHLAWMAELSTCILDRIAAAAREKSEQDEADRKAREEYESSHT